MAGKISTMFSVQKRCILLQVPVITEGSWNRHIPHPYTEELQEVIAADEY